MSGHANDHRKIVLRHLHLIVCALLMLLTAGCGDHSAAPTPADQTTADASRTGSASFSVRWQTDQTDSASADAPSRSAIEDCSAAGIETITCVVYDPSNSPVANGGPWACADHGATMDRIPQGSGLTFVILGRDTADGNITYQGSTASPVTIVPGETTDAGTIIANPFVPTALAADAVSAGRIELDWNDQGAPGYRIYQNGELAATPASPSFSVIDLTPNTQYCYTVSAVDRFGNESGRSNPDCATTWAEDDTEPPTTPTNPAATAVSASQIDLSWTESTDNVGIAGYRIYRNGREVGQSDIPTFSESGLLSDTEYCYTVGAFDGAGNPSPQSPPVCATTLQSVVWYRDGDQDGYGDPSAPTVTSDTQPSGYVSDNTDCDDRMGAIHPGATETCNEVDDDCDDRVDEGVQNTYYLDDDGDRFGDPDNSTQACAVPEGYVDNSADCRDDLPDVNPDAAEVCNAIDDNCNDDIDENCMLNPTASFTARLIGNALVLVGDANDQEGQPFNSNSLFIKEGTSDRVGLEFDIQNLSNVGSVALQFEMNNMDAPRVSKLSMHRYYANGLANAEDYFLTDLHQQIEAFSDNGEGGRQSYFFDITDAFFATRDAEQPYMGILIKADDANARYTLFNPILTVSQE